MSFPILSLPILAAAQMNDPVPPNGEIFLADWDGALVTDFDDALISEPS